MNDPKTAAHAYAKRGWRVIPIHRVGPDGLTCSCSRGRTCTSKGKHPKDAKWQDSPVLSAADIEATWGDERPPNIGIATGAPSGFWVLDIDPKSGGMESMAALVAEHGPMPPTYVVQTGSGGYHYYLAMPANADITNSAGRIGPGIDVRGTGGQVVAPPSKSDLGPYTVVSDNEPSAAPEWVLELAKKPDAPTTAVTAGDLPKPEDIPADEWDRLNSYASKALEANLKRLDELAAKGWSVPWNHTLFEVCCANIEIANSPWNAHSTGAVEIEVFARAPRDGDGFDEHTIRKTWNSALEKVGDKARAVPPKPASIASASGALDPLFSGPDVRNPTQAPAATPSGPGAASGDRLRFWMGKNDSELDVTALATAVRNLGDVAWAREEEFWAWDPTGVWKPNHEVVIERCVDLLGSKFRNGHAANTETVVKRHAIRLNGDPLGQWMNFTNGMLEWATGQMVPHDPQMHSTIQFPHAYDPEATCPNFDRFLEQILLPDYVEMAWEMLGYLLYSGNPLQVAFMFSGSGRNGKGTLLRIIEGVLGDGNFAAESLDDLNNNRFSPVNLYGKIANIAGDIDSTYQESTANFKKLTGQDTYPAERKFGQRFTFENYAVPLFSANKIPGSADVTDGYLRRWVILHFHRKFMGEEKIIDLDKVLLNEAEGIIAKAVMALRTLMVRREFAPKGEALKGKESFAKDIDQARQWIAEPGPTVLESPDSITSIRDLYREYQAWCFSTGRKAMGMAELAHRLDAMGYERVESPHGAGYKGLRVEAVVLTPATFF